MLQSRRIRRLSCKQRVSDAGPSHVPVAADRTAPEPGDPDDRKSEADDSRGDPDPRDEEQEDDSDDDECDAYADHGCCVPVQPERKRQR